LNPTVTLADRLGSVAASQSVQATNDASPAQSFRLDGASADDLALARAQQTAQEIQTSATNIEHKFGPGGVLFGLWVGLVIAAKLISLALRRTRTDYEPDRGACVACARCFEYCPNELARRGVGPSVVAAASASPRV
jgi:hypothetical protein